MTTAELAIIIPTYNERENIRPLLSRIETVMKDVAWELIFVDDNSADGTADEIRAIALLDTRVRCIRRVGRRGLSTACIEGMASSSAEYLAVMDADMQHDEAILPKMFEAVKNEGFDIAVGSRYVEGGGVNDWNSTRRFISRTATVMGQKITRCSIQDPMSGFFLLRRSVFWDAIHNLSGRGFKILLDILASSPRPLRVKEVPYQFRLRQAGQSKLNSMVVVDYILLLLDKGIGSLIPIRFIKFMIVGAIGVIVHLAILGCMHRLLGKSFWLSQATATGCAMILNYMLNNIFTYKDRKMSGAKAFGGLIMFIIVCTVGAFVNVQVADYLYSNGATWWLAGLVGIAIGSVWNYAISTQLVWRKKKD